MDGDASLPVPGFRQGPAWERGGPAFERALETVRGVLLDPQLFFRTMRREGGLRQPVIFYLVTAGTGTLAGELYQFAFTWSAPDREAGCPMLLMPGLMLLTPLLLALSLFISSGITHVMLMLLDGARFPYETTVRVAAYAGGSTTLLGVVPFCGGLIGGVWQIVAIIIGLAEAHEISIGKSALAVLLPMLFCCAIFVALVATIGVAAVMAGLTGGRIR